MSAESILTEVFDGLDRLAPGSESTTNRALETVRSVREPARILDIGCGTGAQTLVLARNTTADIVAVDTSEPFLSTLRQRAARAGLADRLSTVARPMEELRFPASTFDVVWAEGSAYIMGFDVALRAWRTFIPPGGVLACSELTWLKHQPSPACRKFWNTAYPAMRNERANTDSAEQAGFEVLHAFALPSTDWTDEYYAPLRRRIATLKPKCADNPEALAVLVDLEAEIVLYDSFGGEYGYVFYILVKRD